MTAHGTKVELDFQYRFEQKLALERAPYLALGDLPGPAGPRAHRSSPSRRNELPGRQPWGPALDQFARELVGPDHGGAGVRVIFVDAVPAVGPGPVWDSI